MVGIAPGGTIGECEGGGGGEEEGGGGLDVMLLTVEASTDRDKPLDRIERSTDFTYFIALRCLARSRRRFIGKA